MSRPKLDIVNTNIFASNYAPYFKRGYSVIPDRYMSKIPAIKGWSDYCYKLPTLEELTQWCSIEKSNIAIAMGEVSNIIGLDIDETRQEILDLVMPILPPSPVTKVGSKGETRFFRYNGEFSQVLNFNGSVVMEILSNNKKTTIPPSVHPNGAHYKWTNKDLRDIDSSSLPLLPPALFSHIESKLRLTFGEVVNEKGKLISGRNNSLSSLCGKLIAEKLPVDECVKKLVEYDSKENEVPLFSDPTEMRHTEPFTNALQLYSNVLASINSKHFRSNKEYEVPVTASAVSASIAREADKGKSQRRGQEKKLKRELPLAHGVLETIRSNILNNAWIKQPDLALGASLTIMSTLISRKLVFQGMSPNLYVLNISPSGSGKDAPQQIIKKILVEIGADHLLGAGDYVSDASLMDGLDVKPTRLDIMDEAGGILKTATSGRSEYNGKIADILAELYTCSNGKYLGRAVSEGTKGSCYRPNVNILASTTPTGFSEGVSLKAIEKGLLGRFLMFTGDSQAKAHRLTSFPKLDVDTKNILRHWWSYTPPETNDCVGSIPQAYLDIKATKEANNELDKIFNEFDALRRNSEMDNPLLPIIARLYQQLAKISLIHSVSRCGITTPLVDIVDVHFGYQVIMHHFDTIREIVDRYIFGSENERKSVVVGNAIKDSGKEGISKYKLFNKTRSLNKRERDQIIQDLLDSESITMDRAAKNGRSVTVYIWRNNE